MYSPKIREDLIPRVYRAAKSANVAMTKWVSRVIEEALPPESPEDGQKINERHSRKEQKRYER